MCHSNRSVAREVPLLLPCFDRLCRAFFSLRKALEKFLIQCFCGGRSPGYNSASLHRLLNVDTFCRFRTPPIWLDPFFVNIIDSLYFCFSSSLYPSVQWSLLVSTYESKNANTPTGLFICLTT